MIFSPTMFSDHPQRTGKVLTKKFKKIRKEIWAVRKIREQLYINMFWLVPGPKAEPQGVSEEVVPLQRHQDFSGAALTFAKPCHHHTRWTAMTRQWLGSVYIAMQVVLTRVTKDMKANELDHVITTWENHLRSSNSSYRIRRRVWVTQFIHCKTNAATFRRIICTWR